MSKFNNFGLSYSQWEKLIDEWIFNERNRKILKRHLLDCITFKDLAEEFQLSTQQVNTIVSKCKKEVFTHLPNQK